MPSGWSRDPRVKYCRRVVNELLRHPQAKPFSAPVNELWPPESIPNYFVIVKQPMDLGTVKRTLEAGGYCSFDPTDVAAGRMLALSRFESDIRQVFTNAMLYNRPGDSLYQCAFSLRDEFQRLIRDTPEEAPPAAKGAARRGNRRAKPVPTPKAKKPSVPQRGTPPAAAGAAPKAAAPKRASKAKRSSKSVSADASGSHEAAASSLGGAADAVSGGPPTACAAGARPPKAATLVLPQSVREIRKKLAQLQSERAYVECFSLGGAKGSSAFMKRAAMLYPVEMRFEEKERLGENISSLSVDKLGKVVQLVARKSAGRAEVNNNDEYELDMDALDNHTLREMEAYVESCLPIAKRRTIKDVSTFSSVGDIDSAMIRLRQHMTNILERREAARAHRRRMGSYSSEDSDSSDGDSSDSGSSSSGSRSSGSDSSSSGESDSDSESNGE